MSYFLGLLSFILIIPFWLIVKHYGRQIHKNENIYYIFIGTFAFILSVWAILIQINSSFPEFKVAYPVVYAIFFQGHIPFAFYILVMFAGALKPKTKPKIALMMVRRELAIFGFLLLIPHMLLLIVTALTNYNPTGTITFILMIPLFITSFTKIKKKMKPIKWKKLHKWAYPIYAIIYLHVASITIIFNIIRYNDGTHGLNDYVFGYVRFGLYTLIFGIYTYLKFKNYILVKKPAPKQIINKST
ncbi:hypothetical protein [Liberiplasma polymorphum]|uniref:hypothetical protein n=1 Tax=Liberiplasma polymorphum TaxID=3374570 RepID=UPI003771200C